MKNFLFLTIAFILGLTLGFIIQAPKAGEASETHRDTISDTIRVAQTILRDSVILRYQTAYLPIASTKYRSKEQEDSIDAEVPDSVEVVIPIEQKRYQDSTYTAWVSGWRPSLDSIEIYPRTIFVTERIQARQKRWGIGVSAGAAITPGGAQPYIGIGVHYNIATF